MSPRAVPEEAATVLPLHKARFRLHTIDDIAALPPPTWLLADHIPETAAVVLYGAPGTGKSFLALAWSLAVASHAPWLGHVTRWGPVVYVAAEGGSGLGQRVRAYIDAHALTRDCRVLFLCEPVNLLHDADVSDFILDVRQALDQCLKPALVTIDTLARCMAGGDENSARDMGQVIASVDRIRRELGTAVLVVHHTGKQGDSERGSSALRGAVDVMFKLTAEDGALTLENEKQRDVDLRAKQRLRLVPISDSCTIEPFEGTTPVGLSRQDRQALEALRAISVDGGATYSHWREASELRGGTWQRVYASLVRRNYVTKTLSRYAVNADGELALVPGTT